MSITIPLDRIEIIAGERLCLHQVEWQKFEAILTELGEKRSSRIAYYQKTLEIRMPLAEHERAKVIIGDLLKILLDHLNLEWESLGSTTFKKQKNLVGIEPDDCFYIHNYRSTIGMKRINLDTDPPPDLAIEVDLTSKTQISAYESIGVPEIWKYDRGKIIIYLLQNGKYQESATSSIIPDMSTIATLCEYLAKSELQPMSSIRREFTRYLNKTLI
jgi:Uma2 family endonuclease